MPDSQPGVSEMSVERVTAYSIKMFSSGVFFYFDQGSAVKMTGKMC
jgi:hypothetical protein